MAFFRLPTIGEAIAIVLGLMRSNVWLILAAAMLAGKTRVTSSYWRPSGAP